MPHSDSSLLSAFDQIGHPRILVLGDLILDRYTWGDADKISPEAPVVTLRVTDREERLGGAANVCQMLRGLEADVICAGVVGNGREGRRIKELLALRDIDVHCVLFDDERPTTVKERFVGRAASSYPHQILRVDSEVREPLRGEIEGTLSCHIISALSGIDAVLVSDYGKGTCSPRLLRRIISHCRVLGIPVLVDPFCTHDYSPYRGATAITPNRREAMTASATNIGKPGDALGIGRQFCRDLDLDMAIVTLDRDGMALVKRNGEANIVPTRPRSVYDITGAGDMVLAMIGLCLAAGCEPETAVPLANAAGGLEVEQVGVAVLSREEIRRDLANQETLRARKIVSLDGMVRLADGLRRQGRTIVFTNGCFDLLHVGHVTYLDDAARLGDCLVVAINSDSSIRQLKGPQRPIINQEHRARMLEALECVNYVLIFDDETPHRLLEAIRPEILVKGGTYAPQEVVGHEIVEEYGGQVCVTSVVDGVSTTSILESLAPRPLDATIRLRAVEDVPAKHRAAS